MKVDQETMAEMWAKVKAGTYESPDSQETPEERAERFKNINLAQIERIESAERAEHISDLLDPNSEKYNPWEAMETINYDIVTKTQALHNLYGDGSWQSYNMTHNLVTASYFEGDDLQSRLLPTSGEHPYERRQYGSIYDIDKPSPPF